MCHGGSFREDINEKYILCEYPENSIEHVVNKCKKLSGERRKLLENLNKELLKAIEYHYYSKKFSNGKEEKKSEKRGIKNIKELLI